jgi:5-bromo-4-chloroindolyl phosphate hydrolysis protein
MCKISRELDPKAIAIAREENFERIREHIEGLSHLYYNISRMTQKEKFMHELSLEKIKIEYNWVQKKYNEAREKYLRIMMWS